MAWIKEEKLYALIILLLVWIMAARTPLDTDMWWHLRAGEETVANRAVYRVDDFSSTRDGAEWINHSWLSQVAMYGLFRTGGFLALSIWVAVCAVVSSYLVYLRMEGHPLLRGAVLLLAGVTASVVWSPRPQLFSLVLLALIAWIVSRYRQTSNWLVLMSLLPIFALWGNLHGGYVIGLMYLGADVIGDVLDQLLRIERSDQLIARSTVILAGFSILAGLAVLANPFGLDMWRIPFNTVGVETLQNLIDEWASPDFHQVFQQPLLWMLLGLMAVLGISPRKANGRTLLPVLVFAYAALTARRNFGPFAIVAAPVLATHLDTVATGWVSSAREKLDFVKKLSSGAQESKANFNPMMRNIINVALIGALVFAAGYKTYEVNQPALIDENEAEMFPARAAAWMNEVGLSGNLFNDYNWGGYLIYALPGSKVFVDGRTDLYGDAILDDYLAIMRADDGWEALVEGYQVDFLLINPETNLARFAEIAGWQALYNDSTAVLLRLEDKK